MFFGGLDGGADFVATMLGTETAYAISCPPVRSGVRMLRKFRAWCRRGRKFMVAHDSREFSVDGTGVGNGEGLADVCVG